MKLIQTKQQNHILWQIKTMSISNEKLKKFFSEQQVGDFRALKNKIKTTSDYNKTLLENSEKSVSNPLAIREQSVSNPLAIREQSVSNPLAIREQSVSNPLAIREQSEQSVSNPLANIGSSDIVINASSFSGKERELIEVIFSYCQSIGSNISPLISTKEIQNSIKTSPERVRNVIFRVVKKGGLKVNRYISGKDARRTFEIPRPLYESFFDEMLTERQSNPLASSSKNGSRVRRSSSIYNNTTTTKEDNIIYADVWDLNISLLTHIGFTQKHLDQISKRTSHSPEDVQEAIYAFAHDLVNNKLKIRNGNEPLGFFMGIMGKGELYLPASSDYFNPTLKASKLYLQKRKECIAHRKALDDELRTEHFEKWSDGLNEEDKTSILPAEVKNSPFKPHIRSSLLVHHQKKIWPEVRLAFYNEKDLSFTDFEIDVE